MRAMQKHPTAQPRIQIARPSLYADLPECEDATGKIVLRYDAIR